MLFIFGKIIILFQTSYAAAYLYCGLSINREVNDMYYKKLLASHLLVALYNEKKSDLFMSIGVDMFV